jgi:spermidine/putrescine-binding protein
MSNIMSSPKRYAIPLALLMAATGSLYAQAAPRPAQLAAAKTVFISNAMNMDSSVKADFFESFYADVQALNRFSVVASPAQADLVLELSIGTGFVLRIVDPKSTVVLWSMSEPVVGANRTATLLKNQHTALLNLAGDVKQICLPGN